MVKVFSGDNPSKLYLEALIATMKYGKELSPRGKKIKELHPAVVQFTDPKNRLTFLKGRKINPFFHVAEGLWMLLGRSDVAWLTKYNQNMASFSDNGLTFNAAYGERLRNWDVNSPTGHVYNPIDQLYDAYRKLKADPDTRQAFATIGNPRFDNADYTLNGGKDIACNREIFFKIREGKLDITVSNRSNDCHWGLFTANLTTFATYQEMMAAWLGIEVGTYNQVTDSLHVYLEDYGASITDEILTAYGIANVMTLEEIPEVELFTFESEPRMLYNVPEEFDLILGSCEHLVDTLINVDENILNEEIGANIINIIQQCPDKYFVNTLLAMTAYRAHRLGVTKTLFTALSLMYDSQLKLSCLYFLYKTYKDEEEFTELYNHYTDAQKAYIQG